MSGRVVVLGLGPAGADLMSARSHQLLLAAPLARLRTRRHPAADAFSLVPSYDEMYERAESFDELYESIVDDLCELANTHGEVVYAVPGSPLLAERTVELLRERNVELRVEPALSSIDLVVARVGIDPMSVGLRIVDALAMESPLRGPGPCLILQCFSPAVMAQVADALGPEAMVTVLHHLGLEDEFVGEVRARELSHVVASDHLTSLYVGPFRDAGVAMSDLVDFSARLRAECPWDAEQTHGSLTRHLLEEAYEALDALSELARVDLEGLEDVDASAHVEEELGDLLFQVVFHATLGEEEGRFSLASIADTLRDKLTGRHPHVFGDLEVNGASDVARNWESLKRQEKGRTSVVEGVVWDLPALALMSKVVAKSSALQPSASFESALERATTSLARVRPGSDDDLSEQLVDVLEGCVSLARYAGVDLEGALRQRARTIADALVAIEGQNLSRPGVTWSGDGRRDERD